MRDVRNYFLMMRLYKMGNYSSDIKDSQDSKTIPGTHYSARLLLRSVGRRNEQVGVGAIENNNEGEGREGGSILFCLVQFIPRFTF